MKVPEPGDADLLVGTEQRGKGRGERGGREGGEIAEGFAAGFPGGGRLEVRDEFVDEILDLGDAGGGQSRLRRHHGEALVARPVEIFRGGEAGYFFGREQEDLAVVLDVTAVGGEGGA